MKTFNDYIEQAIWLIDHGHSDLPIRQLAEILWEIAKAKANEQ